jgi:hypothetical protein
MTWFSDRNSPQDSTIFSCWEKVVGVEGWGGGGGVTHWRRFRVLLGHGRLTQYPYLILNSFLLLWRENIVVGAPLCFRDRRERETLRKTRREIYVLYLLGEEKTRFEHRKAISRGEGIEILAEERKNTFRRKSNQLRRSIKILAEERKNTFRRKSNQLRSGENMF